MNHVFKLLLCVGLCGMVACSRSGNSPGLQLEPQETEPVVTAPVEESEPESYGEADNGDEEDSFADLQKPASRTPDVVFVPTPQPVVDKMLELAQVKRNDVVYDLGCGDGRIVVTAAKRYGVKAWGFDIDPVRVAEARANVAEAGVGDLVTIEEADIFTLDLSPASVVTLYLLPELNVKLIPQLQKLKPGSRIVSHDFDMDGVKPVRRLTMDIQGTEHEVYLWRTPFKVTSGVR